MIYNILDFGANVSFENNAQYIQKAIDEAYMNGGGVVLVPENLTFRTGSLVLKENCTLHLSKGSVLKASENYEDFNLFKEKLEIKDKLLVPSYINCDYDGRPFLYFIYIKDSRNVTIEGEGALDGNESIFYGESNRYQIDGKFYPRMPLIFVENTKNLVIKDVTLKNSAFWTVHLVGVDGAEIKNIKILNNLKMTNCDGIDPDHSKNIKISNCFIRCADDAIVFKTTLANRKYGDCENIEVKNSEIITTSAAIKFGSESFDNFKNIKVSNLNIHDSNRGISFQLRDGAIASDIFFKNIKIDNRIFSDMQYWGKGEAFALTSIKRDENSLPSLIENVYFENIDIDSENGFIFYGENNIKNIFFKNINLKIHKKSKWNRGVVDLRPTFKDALLNVKPTLIYSYGSQGIFFSNFTYEIDDDLKEEFKDNLLDDKANSITFN